MKNWKCIIGLHDYEYLGCQTVKNVVGGFSMTILHRGVKVCKECEKVHFFAYDITTDAHLNEKLDWQPKLNY